MTSFGAKPETGAARVSGTEEDGVEDMFTVKVFARDGKERMYQGHTVKTDRTVDGFPVVLVETGDDTGAHIRMGLLDHGEPFDAMEVFVMNSHGATVACYRAVAKPHPCDAAVEPSPPLQDAA